MRCGAQPVRGIEPFGLRSGGGTHSNRCRVEDRSSDHQVLLEHDALSEGSAEEVLEVGKIHETGRGDFGPCGAHGRRQAQFGDDLGFLAGSPLVGVAGYREVQAQDPEPQARRPPAPVRPTPMYLSSLNIIQR